MVSSVKQISRPFCVLLLLVACAAARADTLVLKDGRKLEGQVTKTDDGYVIRLKAGQLTIASAEVVSWEKGAPATPTAPPGSVPRTVVPPVAVEAKPITDAEQKQAYLRAQDLIDQGLAALVAGDGRTALESFSDARSLCLRVHLLMDPNDSVMYSLLEGLGVSYMQIGRYDIARDLIERAYNSPVHGRSAIANRALIDLVQQSILMRGVKDVKTYLAAHPEPDETMVMVLGTCLHAAATDLRLANTELYRTCSDFYDKKAKELSALHGGLHLWGAEWIGDKAEKDKLAAVNTGRRAYEDAVSKRDDAYGLSRSIEKQLDAARSSRTFGGGASPSYVNQLSNDLAISKDRYAASERAVTATWKLIPWPEYAARPAPILPDAAVKFTRPATVAVAIATPKSIDRAAIAPVTPPRSDTTFTPPTDTSTGRTTTTSPPVATTPAPAIARRTITRHAVAVPVAPDLLLTSAALVDAGSELRLENSVGDTPKAEFVRKDTGTGLALLRLPGGHMRFLNLGDRFTGGDVQCWSFPEVSIFNIAAQAVSGNAPAIKPSAPWTINLSKHPRLTAGAVLDKTGNLLGVTLCERETPASALPTVTAQQIKAFLGSDAPIAACSNPDPTGVFQLTASRNID